MSNRAVIYYSRDGNTRRVSEFIGGYYDCPVLKIKDKKKRQGLWGFVVSGKDALFKKDTKIELSTPDFDKINTIFLGGPVWVGRIPPALRTFLKKYNLSGKSLVLFCTMGGKNPARFFEDIRELVPSAEISGAIDIRKNNISEVRVAEELKKLNLPD
ncbi:MAG: flavodoxin family protein [Elusimicrobiota bacterium]